MNIFILAYYSYHDPVFQSAVLPYFLNFPDSKHKFFLLTFEHDAYPIDPDQAAAIESFLLRHRIIWKRSVWRSGNWKLFKKGIDLFSSIFSSIRIIRKYKIKAIYSEGFPGAILGHYISLLTGTRHFIHSFEPHTDYMIEAGVWKKYSWEALLLRWHEIRIARHASGIFTATQSMIDDLLAKGVSPKVPLRVPSCVDTQHFRFSSDSRARVRREHAIPASTPVLVYLGKFGGMYMEDEAFEFFKICQDELNAWIFVLSPDPQEKIDQLLKKHQLKSDSMVIKFLTREHIPAYLSAADIGFVAVRQWPSKRYCSPIKTGEYLSCGLPVIVPIGVSDDVEKMIELGICIPMATLDRKSYSLVLNEWRIWLANIDVEKTRTAARSYAESDRSVDWYKHIYASVFDQLYGQ